MSSKRTRLLPLFATILVLGLSADASRAITIDPLTTPFPPNPNLPATHPALLFVGSYCDGAACPPSTSVEQANDQTLQTGLPGVLGGNRLTKLALVFDAAVSRIDPVAGRASFEVPFDGEGELQFVYGTAGALHANLIADGSDAFQFDFGSSANPSVLRFVECSVTVTSHYTEPNEATAGWTENVVSTGPMRFDFSNFTGIDFTQVDAIQVWIRSDLSPDMGISFSIGPIITIGTPTPARTTTWGRLKTLYR